MMTESNLPPNVYRVAQRRFDAIPTAPWVYWVPEQVRCLFEELPNLETVAQPVVGLQTSDNFRFLRYWWEVGWQQTAFDCRGRDDARTSGKIWFPYMKGGSQCKWYGNQQYVVNWSKDGTEIKEHVIHSYPYLKGKWEWVVKNIDYYFRQGITWTDLGASGFSARISPQGFIFDVSGSCAFPETVRQVPGLLAAMNAGSTDYLLGLLNPTLHFQVGDLKRLPIPKLSSVGFESIVKTPVQAGKLRSALDETTFDFIAPPHWDTGLDDLAAAHDRLADLEAQIDDEVYRLYGISDEDRAAIEAELAGEPLIGEEDEDAQSTGDEEEDTEPEPPMTREELAVRWISYATGVVLGRFRPGIPGDLGSAVYRREDFAVGSLPAPDEAEFDQLVGPSERFAYVDGDGGRHVFPAEVEAALRDLGLPDGIAVLDEGHPRDLPTLVEQALQLMLDWDADAEHAAPNTEEVIEIGAGGDLRRFFERSFFTQWHSRWYRKRPVCWPLQSARRSYGFVLFHERIDKSTLYVLQRDYLDHKLNGLRLQIGDLRAQLEGKEGRARKQVERQIDGATQLLEEVTAFAQTVERIVREGYEPEPNWIDDGVILRMAPLWELIPIWWREPKKYWERLQRGDYDWSHIAMNYWPERVKEACKTNKSFAIAHGHEEWYEGA
jgi:hypothetical protein